MELSCTYFPHTFFESLFSSIIYCTRQLVMPSQVWRNSRIPQTKTKKNQKVVKQFLQAKDITSSYYLEINRKERTVANPFVKQL